MEGVRNVLKVSEQNNSLKEGAYQESLLVNYKVWTCGENESVEKEWETFTGIVMECTNDACDMRSVGGREERGVNGGMQKSLLRNGYR